MVIKLIYTLFLGIILATFIGVGISTFYPEPQWPEPPAAIEIGYSEDKVSEETKLAQQEYDAQIKDHDAKMKDYNQNASIALFAIAILLLVIGVAQAHKIDVLADGVLLGGIFTFIYGMGRSVAAGDEIFRFLIISVGLVAALALGYWRFAKPNKLASTKKPK